MPILGDVIRIATALTVLAIIVVIVSKKSASTQVIASAFKAYNAALSVVTGH